MHTALTARAWAWIIGALVYVALVIGSMRANFIPSGVEGWIVVLLSFVLGLVAVALLPQARFKSFSRLNRAWLYLFFSLFAALLWSPIVGVTVPMGTTFLFASPSEQVLTVSGKRSPTRRVHCNGLVLKEYEQLMDNTICVPQNLWESLSPGARIHVKGMANGLGFRVVEVYAR